MKKFLLFFISCIVIIFYPSCKKDKKNDPPKGNNVTYIDVAVKLPAGISIDLSQTKVFTFGSEVKVGSDGKANIPFLKEGQLVMLFDNSNNVMLESYITSTNKEISTKTTAQALLFQSSRIILLPDSFKLDFLSKSINNVKLNDYYSQFEQAFKSNPLVVNTETGRDLVSSTLNKLIQGNPINAFGKQVDVLDDDIKSYLQIMQDGDESVNISHTNYRRTHAFVYKTAYKDLQGYETVINSTINYDDAADKDIKVKKVTYKANSHDMLSVALGFKGAITGPISLPLSANESEATYKIRILGPGKTASVPLTNTEKSKLDELYYEYLAFDILAPIYLDALGYKSLIGDIKEEQLATFLDKVKIIAKTDPSIMENLRKASIKFTVSSFSKAAVAANQSNHQLAMFLVTSMQAAGTGNFPASQYKAEYATSLENGINLLTQYVYGTYVGPAIVFPVDYFEEIEEFEVKTKENTVKISPRESSIMKYANQTLTVEIDSSAPLDNGESYEYEWTTAGNFGKFKDASGAYVATTSTVKNAIYHGDNAPNEDNIEQISLTVYIKEANGTKRKFGTDKATINVKKVGIKIVPQNATLSPKNNNKSITLKVVNSDGTDPLVNGSAIQSKVEWSTPGAYGSFTGGVTTFTSYKNSIVYTSEDDQVASGKETVTAKIYIKLQNTGWQFQQEAKTTVTISNDTKKIIRYTSPQGVHKDTNSWCYVGCIIQVPEEPNAINYAVYDAATGASIANWNVPGTGDRLQGYAPGFVNADVGSGYWVGIDGTWTWGGLGVPPDHFDAPSCGGTYKIVITVAQ